LLRAFNAIAEDNTVFSFNEHSSTIFLIILISKTTGMYSKHIRGVPNNLGQYSYPLILAMMKRVLWAIHKDRLSLRMLMKIEKADDSLLAQALAALNKPSNCHNLWNKSFIYFFSLILFIIFVIFSALFSIFEVTYEHSVHVSPQERCPIISKDYTIRINHGNNFENKFLTESSRI